MAKSKPKSKKALDEDEDLRDEEIEAADEVEAEAEDADEVEADDEPAVDDDDVENNIAETKKVLEEVIEEFGPDDDEPGDDDASVDVGPPPPPKPKISKFALALIFLNWIAAPAFLYFAYVDHVARTQYAHMAFVNYVQVWGLPLMEEEELASVSNHTRPVQRFSPEQLKKAFQDRRTGVSVTDNFQAVEEEVPLRVRPSEMSEAVKKDVFWNLPDPVGTLNDEITRLQTKLPNDIAAVAVEVKESAKSDDEKRAVVQKVLFPLCWDVWQVKKLDDRLTAAKGAELDDLVNESVQRRVYYDLLAPLNVFRPSDIKADNKKFRIERIADLDNFKLEEIKAYLNQRLGESVAKQYNPDLHLGAHWKDEHPNAGNMERDAIEKRREVGFILFTLGQMRKPTLGDKKLYEKGVERAQVVSGFYEFANAALEFVRTQAVLEERIATSIRADRQGRILILPDKKESRTPGFIDDYDLYVDRLIKIVEQIDTAEKRREDLKNQRDHFKKIYDQRALQHKEAIDRLLKARAGTEKYAKELRELQVDLHKALRDLSDAADINFQIEADIRALEYEYMRKTQKKGGKK